MKKNLKKVISAVLSLSLAMSSFVALSTTASAAAFSDVEDTANYAEAINALAALDVLSGYEDGTFLPDNKITRAEVVTMVVAALNMKADAANSGETTKFDDVNAEDSKWAAGYVNVGVSQGFISGMSDTEFAPKMNVTYAHVLTMLTRNLGYGDYAVSRGGFPDGYLEAARAAGILSGVTASANDELTRGQVAQLIWNAVKTPILDTTNFSTNIANMTMEPLDGRDGKAFKTILSDRFGAYVLNVTVENTSKMDTTLEIGDIYMKLTGNNDWDPSEENFVKNVATSNQTKKDVAAGKTEAEAYPFASAKVVATYIDDEWALVYFAPTSKVSTKTVDGSLVKDVSASELSIKKTKTSSAVNTYKLTDDATVYVNGVKFTEVDGNLTAVKNLLLASGGDVTLYQDADEAGTKYDKIMLDVYALARVNQVKTTGDDVEIRLTGLKWANAVVSNPGTSIGIKADDIEEGNKIVTVTKAGAAIDASAIAKDDIVAIKYDLNGDFKASKSIDIFATDEKVTGVYSSYSDDDDTYVVAGETYKASGSLTLDRGTTYTFSMDPFGKLFSAEEEMSTMQYAIIAAYANPNVSSSEANYTTSSVEYSYIDVLTLDGQTKRLSIEASYDEKAYELLNATDGTLAKISTTEKATGRNVELKDRIVSYTLKSNGRVNKIEAAADVEPVTGNYNSDSNRLSKPLAADAVVLDATNYDAPNYKRADIKASALTNLVGTVKYDAILVHKNSSNAYGYVIVTSAGSVYGPTTNFAVAAADASKSSASMVNEEDVFQLRVLENGDNETTMLNIDPNAVISIPGGADKDYENNCATYIKRGAAFVYTTNADGFVDRIDVILEGGYSFDDLRDKNMAYYVQLPDNDDNKSIVANDWMVDVDEKNFSAAAESEIQLFIAPVLTVGSSNVSFSEFVGDYIDTNVDYSFGMNDDTKVYAYDLSDDAETNYRAFSGGSFAGLSLADADELGHAYIKGDFTTETNNPQYGKTDFDGMYQIAFVMAVDGVVTNAIVFNN